MRLIPTSKPEPVIVFPAQLRVMPLAPTIRSPFLGQGPMLPVRTTVVPDGSVIVEPHAGDKWTVLAKIGAGEKASTEPRRAKRSKTASGIFGDSLALKNDHLP